MERCRGMICIDCLHCDVCNKKEWQIDFDKIRDYTDIKKICKFFKDKSRFVELPCKVGTELFLSDYIMHHHRLKEYKFIGNRVVMVIECFEYQRTFKRFVDEHFGKTVFLTKEEAEKALKELNENE